MTRANDSKAPDAFRNISEVAELLLTPAHVLRFWESKFPQVKPVKRAGGRRYYRPQDVALLGGIKHLLHDQGMTIRGVQKMLREQGQRHVAAFSQVDLGHGALEHEQTSTQPADAPEAPPARQASLPIAGETAGPAQGDRQDAAAPAAEATDDGASRDGEDGTETEAPQARDDAAAPHDGGADEPARAAEEDETEQAAEATETQPAGRETPEGAGADADIPAEAGTKARDDAPHPVAEEPVTQEAPGRPALRVITGDAAEAPPDGTTDATTDAAEAPDAAALAARLRRLPAGALADRADELAAIRARAEALLDRMAEASGSPRH